MSRIAPFKKIMLPIPPIIPYTNHNPAPIPLSILSFVPSYRKEIKTNAEPIQPNISQFIYNIP